MDELDMAAIAHRPLLTEVAELSRAIAATPMAAVCLVDGSGRWYAASSGIAPDAIPVDLIAGATGLTIEVTTLDTIAVGDGARGPAIGEHGIHGGVMAPVVAPDGELAGYLCVLDVEPRRFAPHVVDHLVRLANQVERVLDAAVEQHHLRDLSVRLVEGEQALSESLSRLEVSNRELEHFAFFAAHELQAPLRAVAAFASVVEDAVAVGDADPALLARVSKQVQGEAARMRDQVSALLALSRASSGDEAAAAVDLDAVVRDAVAVFGGELCVTVTGDTGASVLATTTALDTVFTNLLSNASKYRHPDREPVVEITVTARDDRVSVAFADNGVGIEGADLPRVFEAFQRIDTTAEGAGVGLTLCRRIVERLGGTVTASSEPGAGSVFMVGLTRAPGG